MKLDSLTPDDWEFYEERAAILELYAGLDRETAEQTAFKLLQRRKECEDENSIEDRSKV